MGDWDFQDRREEMARREVGHTRIRPALSRSLVPLFLLIILSVPVVEHLSAFREYAAGERRMPLPHAYEIFSLLPTALKASADAGSSGFISRVFTVNRYLLREMKGYEETLDDQSVIAKWLRPRIQHVLTGRLGAGNEKAYCGEQPWLFYRPGVDYLTGPPFLLSAQLRKRSTGGSEWAPPVEPDPRIAILDLKEQLTRRGIALIVMPTPTKPMIHPEKLDRRYDHRRTALQNPSYEDFKTDLERNGVLIFDAAPVLMGAKSQTGRDQYLMTDTHWRPEAMALAAEKLKDFIREKVPLPTVPDPQYDAESSEQTQLGDLAVMLDLPADQRERIVRGRIEAVSAVPRPGTVAYKDHVMAVHLTDLEADGRPLAETDAMVYMRSMTDHVWTAAARYRAGDTVRLRLTAWSDVAARYEGINRSELDDMALQLAEPCWGEPSKP